MKIRTVEKLLCLNGFLIAVFALCPVSCSTNNHESPSAADLTAAVESISYYTENYPPFNYEEDGVLYGLSVDLLDEIFKKIKVDLGRKDITVMGWSDAYRRTLEHDNTMLFSTVRNDVRENLFKWVGPIAPHKDVIICRRSGNVAITTGSDLLKYKIGAIEDYSDVQLLADYGVDQSDLYLAKNANELYSMLDSGAVDGIAYSEIGHGLIVSALQLIESDYYIAFVMKVSEVNYAFNINTPDGVINYFQDALDSLVNDKGADGTSVYDRIISSYNIINHSNDGITDEMVVDLVNRTSLDMAGDTQGTIQKINNSEAPYLDPDMPSLYSFVYDDSLTVVAHPTNRLLVGVNLKGKPDVSGKLFRDEILAGALANGTGWEDYIYTKPEEGGLYYKTSYYKLTSGSDGKLYIVCAGKYK